MEKDITQCVLEIEKISITGNIIPPAWYQNIKTNSGKTALLAINILGDVVYWYRPTITRDEATGVIIKKSKKFKSDKLQRQYSQIVDFFGCSKEQAKDAVDLLVCLGLLTREFRTIHAGTMVLNNVMFLEPIPEAIARVSFSPIPSPIKTPPPGGENHPDLGEEKQDTNTEITTQTPTELDIRFSKIQTYLEKAGVLLTSNDPRMMDTWMEFHPDEWIEKAIDIARSKGARNCKYINTILAGWHENGYPAPRENKGMTGTEAAKILQGG